MAIDLDLDSDQQMLVDSIRKLVAQHGVRRPRVAVAAFDPVLWRGLGDIGLWRLGASTDEACLGLVVAACEVLGWEGVAGPVVATLLAAAVLPPELAEGVVNGHDVASLGEAPAMPWGMPAGVFIEISGDDLYLLKVSGRQPIDSLGDEQWAQVSGARGMRLGSLGRVIHLHDLALSAYLGGAARRLVEDTVAHLAQRRQFDKPLGNFQGVAFPLADAIASVDAAQALTRIAALRADAGDAAPSQMARAARQYASRVASRAAMTAHQSLGALGVIENGPVFWISRRLHQWALQVPSDAAARADLDIEAVSSAFLLEPCLPVAEPARAAELLTVE
jgi:alkylation response protein AidB-like acyl-CoA dehydrogenase